MSDRIFKVTRVMPIGQQYISAVVSGPLALTYKVGECIQPEYPAFGFCDLSHAREFMMGQFYRHGAQYAILLCEAWDVEPIGLVVSPEVVLRDPSVVSGYWADGRIRRFNCPNELAMRHPELASWASRLSVAPNGSIAARRIRPLSFMIF